MKKLNLSQVKEKMLSSEYELGRVSHLQSHEEVKQHNKKQNQLYYQMEKDLVNAYSELYPSLSNEQLHLVYEKSNQKSSNDNELFENFEMFADFLKEAL